MKKIMFVLPVAAAVFTHSINAADNLSETLQRGLFEEEANRDLNAAIKAYQSVLEQTDEQRKLAATAVFRLGECYRKLGKTNEANAQFQRILKDYSDQAVLANLSRQNLGVAGVKPGNALEPAAATDEEEAEVKRIRTLIMNSPDLINARNTEIPGGSGPPFKMGTRLHKAAFLGQLAVAEFLLANKAEVDARDSYQRRTPLHWAVANGHKSMAELLLNKGADIQATDSIGNTPLHLAAQNGYRTVVELLLAHGAKVNAGTQAGNTPLHAAAASGSAELVELLLEHHAEMDGRNSEGLTPLHTAAQAKNAATAKVLLEHGANPNLHVANAPNQQYNNWPPLLFAINNNDAAMLKLLLENKADANAEYSNGSSALVAGSNTGQSDAILELLIRHNADPNAIANDRNTALHSAAARGRTQIARLLIEKGADVRARNDRKETPLHLAAQSDGRKEIVELLLAPSSDLDAQDQSGFTPVHTAVAFGARENVELLLAKGANPNLKNNDGFAPLHRAVSDRKKEIIKLLLDHKADPNEMTPNGETPLSLATGSPTVPSPSLPPGTRVLGPPGQPQTAEPSRDEIVEFLRQHGAIENLQRLNSLSASRKSRGYRGIVFNRGTNIYNRYTLLEVIANNDFSTLNFPDLAHVKINRLDMKNKREQEISVDVEAMLKALDCSKDIWLEWGDEVEIPEQDHVINARWLGFPREIKDGIKACLERNIDVFVKGSSTRITLTPQARSTAVNANNAGEPLGWNLSRCAFGLNDVLRNSNILRASSDLTRITVKRKDPNTKEERELVFNLEKTDPRNDLWLRDGDVILIPEK